MFFISTPARVTDGGSTEKDVREWTQKWLKNKKDSKHSKDKKKEKARLLKENEKRKENLLLETNGTTLVDLCNTQFSNYNHHIESDPHQQVQINIIPSIKMKFFTSAMLKTEEKHS